MHGLLPPIDAERRWEAPYLGAGRNLRDPGARADGRLWGNVREPEQEIDPVTLAA
jgi:hypothetical protein